MQNIRLELIIRKGEVKNLLNFAKFVENGEGIVNGVEASFDNITVNTSLKASIIVMLYNVIESTMTKSLNKIHNAFETENLKYDDLNDSIKKTMLTYYQYAMNKSADVHKSVSYVMELIDLLKLNTTFSLSYEDLSKSYSLYSGNLDSRKIVDVVTKYGVNFSEQVSELKTIKDYRNKLAHGELSFEEVGREVSIPQLERLQERTFEYIEKVIMALETYLSNKEYKKQLHSNINS